MNKFLFYLFLFHTMVLYSFNKEQLLNNQFPNGDISNYLKERVPFLQQEFRVLNSNQVSDKNIFSVSFNPDRRGYNYFAQTVGINIFNAKFIVSWYVFTNINQVPNSINQVLQLVNNKQPEALNALVSVNNKWYSAVELPYYALLNNYFVYVYISYPNQQGILLPVAGRSYFRGVYDQHIKTDGSVLLNYELLQYWKQNGLL